MDELCCVCDQAPMKQWHHLTGCTPTSREFLDPGLIVPVCDRCHEDLHEDLRREGLDRLTKPLDLIATIAHRLRRLALFLSKLAGTNASSIWAVIADHLQLWADELTTAVKELAHA